jgi:Cysteine-rich secretory protein family
MQASRFPVEEIPVVAERVAHYTSAPQPGGATGHRSARELAAQVSEELARRGQRAQADGALANTACWALDRVHRGRQVDSVSLDAASRRFGFGGVVATFAAFGTSTDAWREPLDRTPSNVPLNRLGVCVSPSGSSASLVVGAQEMQYDTIPRDFEVGQQVTIRGRVGERYESAVVYVTKPDGTVDRQPIAGTTIDASFLLSTLGQYRLEVMGDGPTGPFIVANMPLYVGVAEPIIRENAGTVVEPDVAEVRMLEQLNQARKAAGVAPLAADSALRQLARGHTEDMVDHAFFSHVSPSQGTPQDRFTRSGLLFSQFGENIAAASTPEDAHTGLMESPGHRANMLNPGFSHVGIAAGNGPAGLVVTLNFGRRPNPEDLPTFAQVAAAFKAMRNEAGLTTPAADPVYTAGAQAGADAMARDAAEADVAKAEASAMQREVDRLRTSRGGSCVFRLELLELAQLKQIEGALSPQLRRYGIGGRLHRDEKGQRLSAVFMLEGVPCR